MMKHNQEFLKLNTKLHSLHFNEQMLTHLSVPSSTDLMIIFKMLSPISLLPFIKFLLTSYLNAYICLSSMILKLLTIFILEIVKEILKSYVYIYILSCVPINKTALNLRIKVVAKWYEDLIFVNYVVSYYSKYLMIHGCNTSYS